MPAFLFFFALSPAAPLLSQLPVLVSSAAKDSDVAVGAGGGAGVTLGKFFLRGLVIPFRDAVPPGWSSSSEMGVSNPPFLARYSSYRPVVLASCGKVARRSSISSMGGCLRLVASQRWW